MVQNPGLNKPSGVNLLLLVARTVRVIAVVLVQPLSALETLAVDRKGSQPAGDGDAGKEPPRERLPFRSHACRQRKEAAREEGPDATAGRREGLGESIEGAKSLARRSGVGDLGPD